MKIWYDLILKDFSIKDDEDFMMNVYLLLKRHCKPILYNNTFELQRMLSEADYFNDVIDRCGRYDIIKFFRNLLKNLKDEDDVTKIDKLTSLILYDADLDMIKRECKERNKIEDYIRLLYNLLLIIYINCHNSHKMGVINYTLRCFYKKDKVCLNKHIKYLSSSRDICYIDLIDPTLPKRFNYKYRVGLANYLMEFKVNNK